MKKVQILLSTYNGERFIREQLDSILDQDYLNIAILIRDDGSTDKTPLILEEYADKYKNITYYQGENIGVIQSFFNLMKNADISADYYSLSDQDDWWIKGKITRAVKQLDSMNRDKPLLYCGRTTLVDQNLKPLNVKMKPYKINPDFGNALVENICTGCTTVINRNLLQLIQDHIPHFTVMHDWWIYLTASYYGEIYYDEKSYILYRQHGKNVMGSRSNYIDEFKMRLKNFKNNKGKICRQAKEFRKIYTIKDNENLSMTYITEYQEHVIYRFKILFTKDIFRQRGMDNFIFKILFLIGHV